MTEAPKPVKPLRSRRRTWLFRLLAMLLGPGLILVIECGLRLFGVGADLELIIPHPGGSDWYQLNPRFDQPYFGRGDLSGPEPQPFRLPKPSGTRRIFVVGGSTVIGFPYASELAFPRSLQILLGQQVGSGERIEVLNAGITALNSNSEVAVVQAGLRAEPDVIVVYTGHNEFYGPGGAASSGGWLSPSGFRAVSELRKLSVFQWVQSLTKPTAPTDNLLESLSGDLHIALDSTVFKTTVARFQENLSAMARSASDAGIPIVFVSPVSNEHDQPPIEDFSVAEVGADADLWRQKLRRGQDELEWGEVARAIELLEAAKSEREHDPRVRFRLAQASEQVGQMPAAIEHYRAALDHDGCRFRAPSAMRLTMSVVATQHVAGGARFLDLHAIISANERSGVPGRKHFLEHVHFTSEGHRVVAESLARTIWQDVWGKSWSADRSLDAATLRAQLAVQDEDELAARALSLMIYQKPPFQDGADAPLLAKKLVADSISRFRNLPLERQRLFEQLSSADMSGDLLGVLIENARTQKLDELHGHWLAARVIRQPWQPAARSELVQWLRTHARNSEADRLLADAQAWP